MGAKKHRFEVAVVSVRGGTHTVSMKANPPPTVRKLYCAIDEYNRTHNCFTMTRINMYTQPTNGNANGVFMYSLFFPKGNEYLNGDDNEPLTAVLDIKSGDMLVCEPLFSVGDVLNINPYPYCDKQGGSEHPGLVVHMRRGEHVVKHVTVMMGTSEPLRRDDFTLEVGVQHYESNKRFNRPTWFITNRTVVYPIEIFLRQIEMARFAGWLELTENFVTECQNHFAGKLSPSNAKTEYIHSIVMGMTNADVVSFTEVLPLLATKGMHDNVACLPVIRSCESCEAGVVHVQLHNEDLHNAEAREYHVLISEASHFSVKVSETNIQATDVQVTKQGMKKILRYFIQFIKGQEVTELDQGWMY